MYFMIVVHKYPTQLAKMSFDEILDLTAYVLFYFILGSTKYQGTNQRRA